MLYCIYQVALKKNASCLREVEIDESRRFWKNLENSWNDRESKIAHFSLPVLGRFTLFDDSCIRKEKQCILIRLYPAISERTVGSSYKTRSGSGASFLQEFVSSRGHLYARQKVGSSHMLHICISYLKNTLGRFCDKLWMVSPKI